MFYFMFKGRKKLSWQEEFPCTHRRVKPFVLFRPSTDWVRPTLVREGNLLYSVYRFNVNCFQNQLAETPPPRIMCHQISGHPVPS